MLDINMPLDLFLTKFKHVQELVQLVREEDRREVEDISGRSLYANLVFAMENARPCLTARTKAGELVFIAGVVPTAPREGAVALIGTRAIECNRLAFMRASLSLLSAAHSSYDRLYNVVDCRNKLHIRYLEWLGFTMGNRIEKYGAAQIPVIEFERRVK